MATCTCNQAQPFDIIVNNEKRVILGLDVIVFLTTIHKPADETAAKEKLWESALQYNKLSKSEEDDYKIALYDAYLDMKHLFERYQ